MKHRFLNKFGKILIVAEIGVNHEGDINVTIGDLIKKAAAGVDAVKFQTYQANTYISDIQPDRKKIKKFQLSKEEFKLLSLESKKKIMLFFSTPLHFYDIDFLSEFCSLVKISSGDLAHLELLNTLQREI